VEDQALKWWHVRWGLAWHAISSPAIVFGKVVGLLCLIAAIGFGVDYLISPWLESQRIRKFDSLLSVVPADLPTKAEGHLSSVAFDAYGFRLLVPSEEIARTIQGEVVTLFQFRNGGDLTIYNTAQNSGILEIAINDKHANLEKLVGRENIKSKFKLMRAAMWATPEQTKWWKFRSLENERVAYLLLIKFSVLGESRSSHPSTLEPIFAIASGEVHGFQIGNPGVSPYEAHLDLFDGADRHFAFDVSGPEGHGQVLTQEEINALVGSIRPAADR
jgi:hypothetical protein